MGATKPLWFDREALVGGHGGNEEELGKVVRHYLREAPRSLAALSAAIAQLDAERIELAAHHVAGELLCLHARPAAAIARQIERAAAAGRVHGTPALMSVLAVATRQLLVALVPLAVGLQREELERAVQAEEPELVYVLDELALAELALADDEPGADVEPAPVPVDGVTSAPGPVNDEVETSCARACD